MKDSPRRQALRFGRVTPLAGALALTFCTGLAVSPVASTHPTLDGMVAVAPEISTGALLATPAGDSAYYTVVLRGESLATYAGGLAGLPVPARLTQGMRSGRLDVQSPAALTYVAHLKSVQGAFVNDISATFGRPVNVMAQMQHALNAVIVGLTAEEAAQLALRSDVLIVEREHELELQTYNGPAFIGAPAIWNGLINSGAQTRGEGILVGIIDSGINWESPSFAATSPIDGYVHQNPFGAGVYRGNCTGGGVDAGRCNDKLVGIYNFAAAGTSGTDTGGHGSHTASTTAGNRRSGVFSSGTFEISGVAPRANVIAYLACPTTCPTTATSQSVNQAVIDGVDVINYSISGGVSPWTDTTSVAFRNATAAGVFIAASAGNTSTTITNPQGNVNHLEPWVQTVAASTHDRIIAVSFDLTGQLNPPANTQGIPLRSGAAPQPTTNVVGVPLIKSPGFSNGSTDGCSAYPANTFTRFVSNDPNSVFMDGFEDGAPPTGMLVGGVAVLNLDGTASNCGSGARRTAALAAGAVGVIFVDVDFLNLGASGTSWSMRRSDWNNVEAGWNPARATLTIDIVARTYPQQGDRVANFSLRGPRLINGQGLVKPDITGPGVDILAVGAAGVVGPNGIYLSSGTSMSSPHLAGSAALIRALQPTWTPAEVKSALNLSSNNFNVVNQDGSPVRPWDYGSGRVNLEAAANVGLVMNIDPAAYEPANPAAGGQIATLNLPSIGKNNAIGVENFTRTFRRVRSGSQTYNLTDAGYPAGALQFSPSSFTIGQGASQTVTITVSAGLLNPGVWTLGEMLVTPAGGTEPNLHLPVVMFPGGPAIEVSPTSIAGSSSTSVTNNLTIRNIGNPTLNWNVQSTGPATLTPFNTTNTTNGQLAGSYVSPTRSFNWLQNFDLTAPIRVTTLRANGFTLPSTTPLSGTNTPTITFSVYADIAGTPAGAPGGFGSAPLWTFTGAISAANGITTTGGALSLNLLATNVAGTPLELPAGRFWLAVTPTTTSSAAQTAADPLWAWYTSADAPVGNVPHLYAPHENPAAFQPPTAGLNMLSGFVQGTLSCDLPGWVGLTTTSGSLGFQGQQTIPVQFNAGSLAAGTYTANLCIASNAGNAPVVPVPLSFTVQPPVANPPTLAKAFAPASVVTGVASTLTLTLTNSDAAVSTLSANLVDTFPSGVVVAATPNAATTCGGGSVTAAAGSGSVSLGSGATIPAAGSCTVNVDVTAATAGGYVNTIPAGALQTSTGNNAASASDTLTVTEPPQCTTGQNIEVAATAGTMGPTGYPTLKDAFDAINAGTHSGVLAISVCGNTTEAASAALNADGVGSASYSAASIKPANGAARSISGDVAGPLVDLNGADNVTIDGLNSGGNALTIANTNTGVVSTTSTIRFFGGATGNTVTNASLQGSATMALTTNGGVVFFSTGNNDNNTVSNNNIGPAGSNLPTKLVYGNGSTATLGDYNDNIVISGNNLFDFFNPAVSVSGVYVNSGNNTWTINNNRIYQTAARTFNAGTFRYAGITLSQSTAPRGSFTVNNNVIGFGSANGTGTTTISGTATEFRGIDAPNVDTVVATSIQGNTISGIEQTTNRTSTTSSSSAFVGMLLGTSNGLFNVGGTVGNTFGSLNGSSTIVINGLATAATAAVLGIYDFSFTDSVLSNNRMGAITIQGSGTTLGFRGILLTGTAGQTVTIANNIIGGVGSAGAILDSQSGAHASYGIQSTAATANVTGNTISNLITNANGASVNVGGMLITATGSVGSTIARNTVHSLTDISAGALAGAVYAIDLSFAAAPNLVERNLVHSISVTSTATYQVFGLIMRGGTTAPVSTATATIQNNMIRLGFDAAGNPITSPFLIVGIRDSAGTAVANQYYHNSVYVGGSGVVGGAIGFVGSYALNSDTVTATARNFQNNIFWNARSNVAAAAVHVAARYGGTAANPAGLNANFNDIYATGTDGVVGLFNGTAYPDLASFRAATGQDANSFSADPQFIAPTGNAATGNLHISPSISTPIEATGTPIATVTNDYDGELRSGLTPTDVGADAGNFLP